MDIDRKLTEALVGARIDDALQSLSSITAFALHKYAEETGESKEACLQTLGKSVREFWDAIDAMLAERESKK